MAEQNRGILDGVTVLDFTRAVAGSYATRLLCDMGARILKIEAPEAGEGIRYITVDDPRIGKAMLPTLSPMFIFANAGKQCICMDFKKPESIDLIKKLVAKVDVVVENFTAHVMPSYGLSYQDLCRIKPDLIMCSLTGYGQEGPLANQVANDAVAQAMGGMCFLWGEEDGYPSLAGNGIVDTFSGTIAAMSIVAALFNRQRTGAGEYIDVAMMDVALSVDCNAHPCYAASRGEYSLKRNHRQHFLMCPWGIFKGPNNRYFAIHSDWTRLCNLMGRPELIEDPDFATGEARLRNRDKVHDIIESFLQSFDSDEAAYQALVEGRVAAGPVLDPWEVQNHPQMAWRNMVREVEYPTGVSIPTIATAPHFRKRPIRVGRAPFVGEHNREVLREFLELSDDELDGLHERGVLHEHSMVHALRAGEAGS